MKRWIALLLVLTIALTLFAGCEKKEKAPEETQTGFVPSLDTNQTASFTIVGSLSNFEALEAVIAEFKKVYPNVTITYEKMDDYNNTIEKRLKNDPSVACCVQGPRDYALDLLSYGYDTSAFAPIVNGGMKDGKLLTLPLGYDVRGLVVNTTLLKKEGLSVPTNLGEFESVCDALLEKGYIPMQQKIKMTVPALFMNSIWQVIDAAEDSQAFIDSMSTGEAGSMECMRPIFETIAEFMDKGYFTKENSDSIGDDYEKAILNFFEGDVPFLPASSDTVSGMKKRESKSEAFTAAPFDYTFIYAPLGPDGAYIRQSAWTSIQANTTAENKELAVEFLKFLGREENLNLLAEVKGIPSVAQHSDDPRFANVNDAKGTYIHTWEYQIESVVWNSTWARMRDYADGAFESIDEALAAIENDIAIQK